MIHITLFDILYHHQLTKYRRVNCRKIYVMILILSENFLFTTNNRDILCIHTYTYVKNYC